MKSMLHEASTVEKAIQKAWLESGKPEEFSVKVLEAGERGFLWFSKRPAIVSISFDPKTPANRQHQGRPDNRRNNQPQHGGRNAQQQQRPIQDTLLSGRNNAASQQQATSRGNTQQRQPQAQDQRTNTRQLPQQNQPQRDQRAAQNNEELQGWTKEYAQEILAALQEICTISNIDYDVDHRIDGRSLTIQFAKSFFTSREDERSFFISLSYLLVQGLKKKHKKKFKGFHLILNAKQSRNDGNTRSNTSAE